MYHMEKGKIVFNGLNLEYFDRFAAAREAGFDVEQVSPNEYRISGTDKQGRTIGDLLEPKVIYIKR